MIGIDDHAPAVLDRLMASAPPPFAIVHRPVNGSAEAVDLLVGTVSEPPLLSEIRLPPTDSTAAPVDDVLIVVPYRQVVERGFACVDDGSPLLVLHITDRAELSMAELLRELPDTPITLRNKGFDIDDAGYADLVTRIVAEEIGTGAGANFVLRRSYLADISDYGVPMALSLFRRLLIRESGAYWTFIVHTGDRTFVGATPERHVSLRDGVAVMNPISGTYRYPPSGPKLGEVLDFLSDHKEASELYMVVDEELKMMSRFCASGGRVIGPYLKEMADLAHTEYFIEGRTESDPRDILRETMFAPTVTGSPLENACHVISRYESGGRGYYSGVAALVGRDGHGGRTMDSAILIRTADIDRAGRLRIGVGATIVQDSDPASEVAETQAKVTGLLTALGAVERVGFGENPAVRAALAQRNVAIADFWLNGPGQIRTGDTLAQRSVLVVDAEDTFTAMLGHQLRSIGLAVTVCRFDQADDFDRHDVVIMGPGPGDPRRVGDPKIASLSRAIDALLAARRPFLAVCLSHQVLGARLGFDIVRREVPNQGVQRRIPLFGSWERVAFYNTYIVHSDTDERVCEGVGAVEISRDRGTGEVYAIRGPHFASMQFHAESILSENGMRIISDRLAELLASEARIPLSPR
ncbi:anthranilate synthase family protein [Nocardia sp. NPDC051052]|uniref:anthranilate synthase family protein n=1 Tax=Nocardia sp. NPDC051052 TaxID=3364322 RepID=UPI0037A3331F